MDICWNTDVMQGIGNMLGYRRMNANLKNAMVKLGVGIDLGSDLCVQVRSPDTYAPMPGKINVWMTMFESTGMPPLFIENLRKADILIVPSEFCAEAFRPHVNVPIFVVPLGVDASVFAPVRRTFPKDKPFRWLWVGARNTRKGWNAILETWKMDGPRGKLADNPDVELYLKTVDDNLSVQKQKNAILDSRLVGDAELAQIYQSAQALAFPTMAEGFSLTPLEAMSTALPCVLPLHTGLTEFATPEVCFPVKYGQIELAIDSPALQRAGSFMAPVFPVDPEDLYRQMWNVMDRYSQALVVGYYASKRAAQFSWGRSAMELLSVLRGMKDDKNAGIMREAS